MYAGQMQKTQSPAGIGFTGHDRRRLAKALHQTQEVKVYQRIQHEFRQRTSI